MSPAPRFGVEEEFLILEGTSFQPLPVSGAVLAKVADHPAGGLAEHELHGAQLEVATPPLELLDELRASLTALRQEAARATRACGGRLVASGTYPAEMVGAGREITPDPRYGHLVRAYGEIARDQLICGCHVHVEMPDPDLGISVMNRARRWVPVILAIGANSPFASGRDSGYASFRTEVWSRWPTSGPPGHYESRSDYDRQLKALVSSGAILDENMAYWDIRPSMRYPTLEFRVCDVTLVVDHAVLVAGLIRGLAMTGIAEVGRGDPEPPLRHEMLRAAHWRAARSGMAEDLIDPLDGTSYPAGELIARFLDHIGPALEESGDRREVERLLDVVFAQGNGAEQQRQMFTRRESFEGLLAEVARRTEE